MARPDRAVLAGAGLTVVLGVAFVASTAGATDARALDGLGWALVAANVLPLLALRRAPLLVACFSVAYPAWRRSNTRPTSSSHCPPWPPWARPGRRRGRCGGVPWPCCARPRCWPQRPAASGTSTCWRSGTWPSCSSAAGCWGGPGRPSPLHQRPGGADGRPGGRPPGAGPPAVLEERTRIARNLHDILAHAMSVITVQAGGGGHLLERDPAQAKEALRVIEETGRGPWARCAGWGRCGPTTCPPQATWDLVRQVGDDGATVVLVTLFMEEAEHL